MRVAADTPYVAAVDLAEWLVARGMPFREAHGVVGGLVRDAVERHVPLRELVEAHPALGTEAADLLDPGGGGDPEDDARWGRPRPGGCPNGPLRGPSRGDPGSSRWSGTGLDRCPGASTAGRTGTRPGPAAAPEQAGGHRRRPGRTDHRGGGLPGDGGSGQPRLPGAYTPQYRHVRSARAPVRLPELRGPLVRQRGVRAARGCASAVLLRALEPVDGIDAYAERSGWA